MADLPPTKRKWSLKKKLAIFVLLPFLVLLGSLLIFDVWGGTRLNRARREALADGGLMTFEELEAARRVWPDDENGAQVLIDLAAEFEALENDPELDVLPDCAYATSAPLGYRLRPEQMEAAAEKLEELAPLLTAIDRLRDFKGGRFPVVIKPLVLETTISNPRPVRLAVKLKAAQALERAMRGDTSHVVDDVTVIRRSEQLLAEEALLISALIRIAGEERLIAVIEHTLGLSSLSAEQLQQLDALVAGMEGEEQMSWAVRGGRVCFIRTAEVALAGGAANGTARFAIMIPGVRGFLEQDVAIGLAAFNRLVAAGKNPQKARKVAQELDMEMCRLPDYRYITHLLMPSTERWYDFDLNLEARIRATRTALAAERYRMDAGRFPVRLADLVPEYLSSVPSDPYDGQPLRYLTDERGVVIYSIADNETDDGGQVAARVPVRKDVRVAGGKEVLDRGFALLPPDLRGQPSTRPADEAEDGGPVETPEQKAERLRRFREGGRY